MLVNEDERYNVDFSKMKRQSRVTAGVNFVRCPLCGGYALLPVSLRQYWKMRAEGSFKTFTSPKTTCGHKIVVTAEAV